MFKRLLHARIRMFERRYDYDMAYAHEILDTDTQAFRQYAQAIRLARIRDKVPATAFFAAKLAVTLTEDCGPCTQLVVRMAEEDAVPTQTIRAALEGDEAGMDPEARLAFRFARAVLAHDPAAGELRTQILQRWGQQAVVSLALAMAGSRLFPTIKYAMGFGQTCQRVRVGSAEVVPTQVAMSHAIEAR